MHTVLKKFLLTLLLAGAATGTARAAEILYQAGNNALLPPSPGDINYITEADLIALSNMAPASTAQAAPPTVSPIPEPPVYVMLLIGVGLVSLVARRPAAPPKFSSEA